MKHCIIFCLLFLMAYDAMSQVTINDALLAKSEVIKLNRSFVNTSSVVHKVTVGPFKIVDINKGKQHLVGRQTEDYLEIKGKSASMKKSVSKIKSQPFSITIIQDGPDSIISNMDIISIRGGNHALIEISSGKAENEENTINYCEDMVIQVKSDSLNWHMPQDIDPKTDLSDFTLMFDGIITNGVENILVKGAEGFPVKRKMFENHTKGLVFLFNKKQVAALETYPETLVLFSNDINPRHKQVIAGVVISLLSITNSVMR